MQIQTIVALLAIATLAWLALIAAAPGALVERLRSRRRPRIESDTEGHASLSSRRADDATRPGSGVIDPADALGTPIDGRPTRPGDAGLLDITATDVDLRPQALDRIIRVATWIFLFAATTIVVVTGLWADREGAILAVLAAAGLYTFVLHEVIPRRVPDAIVLVTEGIIGLAFAALLVALTGGVASPFFFAMPLIVVGAAVVVSPGATLALTGAAGLAYIAVIALAPPSGLQDAAIAIAGINLTELCLVAYVGMAIGREQRRAREDVLRRATVDQLTGLRTRAYLFGALEKELIRSQRTGRGFCLLMIDLDDLKVLNDRHGHLHGDRALRVVGDVIQAGTRRIDTGSRFGGDEFVVLLPETDPTGGWVLAEKIRQGVADAGLRIEGDEVATSVSVGLVTYPEDGATIRELLERADDAMYRSKRSGRDRVTGVPVMDAEAARQGREAASPSIAIPDGPAGSERRPV